MAVLGASGCDIKILNDRVEKTGPAIPLGQQYRAYQRMRVLLGSSYLDFFPEILGFQTAGEVSTLILEKVGEMDLEQTIIGGGDFSQLLRAAIPKILEFHQLTLVKNRRESALFLKELILYWRFKLVQLGWPTGLLAEIENQLDALADELLASACHRDLGAHNLVWGINEQIRFIDPQLVLSGAVLGRVSRGAPVRDWATLTVNLERRFIEAESPNLKEQLQIAIEAVAVTAEDLIAKGWFSKRLWLLNKAAVYTSRAACQCQFCSVNLRRLMAKKAHQFINQQFQGDVV